MRSMCIIFDDQLKRYPSLVDAYSISHYTNPVISFDIIHLIDLPVAILSPPISETTPPRAHPAPQKLSEYSIFDY